MTQVVPRCRHCNKRIRSVGVQCVIYFRVEPNGSLTFDGYDSYDIGEAFCECGSYEIDVEIDQIHCQAKVTDWRYQEDGDPDFVRSDIFAPEVGDNA